MVTIKAGNVVHGLTVSAFASVSPDPPLVAVIIDHRHQAHELLQQEGVSFAVNILRHEDVEISNRFAWLKDEERFQPCPHSNADGFDVIQDEAGGEVAVQVMGAAKLHSDARGRGVVDTRPQDQDPRSLGTGHSGPSSTRDCHATVTGYRPTDATSSCRRTDGSMRSRPGAPPSSRRRVVRPSSFRSR